MMQEKERQEERNREAEAKRTAEWQTMETSAEDVVSERLAEKAAAEAPGADARVMETSAEDVVSEQPAEKAAAETPGIDARAMDASVEETAVSESDVKIGELQNLEVESRYQINDASDGKVGVNTENSAEIRDEVEMARPTWDAVAAAVHSARLGAWRTESSELPGKSEAQADVTQFSPESAHRVSGETAQWEQEPLQETEAGNAAVSEDAESADAEAALDRERKDTEESRRSEAERTEEKPKAPIPLPPSVWQKLMAGGIGLGFLGIFLLGLAMPLRPDYSDTEKRALAGFPQFSPEGVWSGTYFTELNNWYSETYPFRETLLQGSSLLTRLYGVQGEAVYGGGAQQGEMIPESAAGLAPTMSLSDWGSAEGNGDSSAEAVEAEEPALPEEGGAEETAAAEAPETSPAENFETDAEGNLLLPKGGSDEAEVTGEQAGVIYVVDNQAYELYYFSQSNVTAYASMLNTVQAQLPEVTIYDMIVPNSFGVQLDSGVQGKLASAGMDQAIDFCYSLMDPAIQRVSVFETLSEHREEYVYFRTDHHWTQLGAYYAYLEFCRARGLTPHSLSDFAQVSYEEFYGTFYFATNRAEALKQNPDTVEAWIPMGTNDALLTSQDGSTSQVHVVNDGSAMLAGNRYNTFLLGDHPFLEITNPSITDGSGIVLLKESYGNAFAPFLVDHYQHVYVVDYRYYAGNLREFMAEHGVSEILFLNNMMALGQRNSEKMLSLFR